MKLRELEKRLKQEPNNLGLRVTVAGLLCEGGRTAEAIELYRSVALAYRDQGRTQQAVVVCRSILEIAPDDPACKLMLVALLAPPEVTPPPAPSSPALPARRSSHEVTPLPRPIPHHIADPTSSQQRISTSEVIDLESDLPATEGAATRPGDEERVSVAGLAQAARTISGMFATESPRPTPFEDLSSELDTRQRPRIESEQIRRIAQPPPTVPVDKVELDETAPLAKDVPTDRETALSPRDSEDELTAPRDRATPTDD